MNTRVFLNPIVRTVGIATACFFGLTGVSSANTTPLGATTIATTAETNRTCESPVIERPFARFGDRRDYVLAPGGSFEGLAEGWQLSGNAGIVFGTDPFLLGSTADAQALSLPAGTSAITPAFCIDLNYPTFRFVSKAVTRPDDAQLRVEVVYPGAANPEWTDVVEFDGKQGVYPKSGWRVSGDIELKPDFGGDRPGPRPVAVRITAVRGTWNIDDLFIDPRMK